MLYHALNRPIAVIEAKDNTHGPSDGMQQALDYAEALDVPFAFTSNGDGFVFHDRTVDGATPGATVETHLTLDQFPAPADLWARYCTWRGLDATSTPKAEAPYYDDGSGRAPRYYQINAINRTVEAVATELLTLCDQLKACIAAARAKHAHLGQALVAHAAAG